MDGQWRVPFAQPFGIIPSMRSLVFLLSILLFAQVSHAVGTRKKRQKITVRREFTSPLGAASPVETHRDSLHTLYCRGTGIERCWWKAPPRLFSKGHTLESIDSTVFSLVSMWGANFTYHMTPDLAVHVRKVRSGYEYIIEEGYEVRWEEDWDMTAAHEPKRGVRDLPVEWRTGGRRRAPLLIWETSKPSRR